jgi:Holliday junction DNA helicase RuvA
VDAALNGRARQAPWRDQVHTALVGLGYTARDADEALAIVSAEADAADAAGRALDVAALLKSALRALSVR